MSQIKTVQDFLKTYYFEEEKLQFSRAFALISVLVWIFPSGPLLIIFSYALHPYLAIFSIFLTIVAILILIRSFLYTFPRFSPVWKSLAIEKNSALEIKYRSKKAIANAVFANFYIKTQKNKKLEILVVKDKLDQAIQDFSKIYPDVKIIPD